MLSFVFMTVDMDETQKIKFETIFNKYKNTLYNQVFNIVKNENDSEDILQEAFIKIAKNIKCINDTVSKETLSFLIVISKNTAYDFLRKKSKIIEMPIEYICEEAVSDDKIDALISDLEYQKIVSVIKNIPSPYNEVLYIHYVKDYSLRKIADLLGRKVNTVKMQLVRGKKILIDRLSEARYDE